MSERSIVHDTFELERVYPVTPATAFAAWAEPEAKARWFAPPHEPGWDNEPLELDFRVGGRERTVGRKHGGALHTYNAIYWDIVVDERIVYSYEMLLDEARISVSLATVEFAAGAGGTRLTFTEHGAYLDGFDFAESRRGGVGSQLDALARELSG